ncbi:MAG: DNA-binding protein WhiA [Actinomycetota bacterium]|nr:DNA-binding protein WhiA [Actinomycetota bacterium]
MSFSTQVKNELARLQPNKRCCQRAELSAILRMDGSFHIRNGAFAFHTLTENAAVARKTLKLFSSLSDIKLRLEVKRSIFQKANDYILFIPPQPELYRILMDLEILNADRQIIYGIVTELVRRSCCAITYLRGAFLGGGFINDPRKKYHFELTTDDSQFALDLKDLLERFEINAKIFQKRKYVIYLKEAEQILRFLALVGAFNAVLKWEDIRILKEMRNQVNRLVNCDTANLNKVVEATLTQISDITLIEEEVSLYSLSKGLREVAQARIQFPYVSLRELGELCNPPLSKSAVYHRMRRLNQIAKNLREGK